MKILLIDNVANYMEIFRLNPDEEELMNDYDSDENCDLQPWERMEKILKNRGIQFNGDAMTDLRYTFFSCEDFPIFENDFDEPVYVIK